MKAHVVNDLMQRLNSDMEFSVPVPLSKKDITLPFQEDMDGGYNEIINIAPYSGYCFEMITQAIFESSHHNGGSFYLPDERQLFQPDLFNHKSRAIYESKSCHFRMQPKLVRQQIEAYSKWQLSKVGNKYPQINFVLFVHGILGMIRRKLTKEEYTKEFSQGILYAIKMPFAVPLQFFFTEDDFISEDGRPLKLIEYDHRREGIKHTKGYSTKSITSLSSLFPRKLILNPERTLTYMHLDPDDFKIERGRVEGININHQEINPFPMMDISLKNHRNWMRNTKKKLEQFVEYGTITGKDIVNPFKIKKKTKTKMPKTKDFSWETGRAEQPKQNIQEHEEGKLLF